MTDNANGPLGAYLVHYRICRKLETPHQLVFRIRQGEDIKRDGEMVVHVKIKDHQPKQVQIIGQAVIVFQTEIVS